MLAGTPGNNGWYVSDVVASLTSEDPESGVKEIRYGIDGGAEVVTAGGTATAAIAGDGSHTFAYYAVDNAGNAEAARTAEIRIDKTAPQIAIIGVLDGATYELGLVPAASYTASDSLSGTASSSASLTGGDGLGLGTFDYTVTAADNAGNSSVFTVTYRVIATPNGILALIQSLVASGQIAPNIAGSLTAKIENVQQANTGTAADGMLQAFINQIEAQTGNKITPEAAAVLTNAARYMMDNN